MEQIMKTEQIIKTLQEYNDWRRARGKWDTDTFDEGESFFDSVTAHEIGVTLDAAIEQLQELLGKRWLIKHYERIYDESDKGTIVEGVGNCVKKLKKERDEARQEAETLIKMWIPRELRYGFPLPWEKGNE
jgi:predicted RNase H-like HicB family nuclease